MVKRDFFEYLSVTPAAIDLPVDRYYELVLEMKEMLALMLAVDSNFCIVCRQHRWHRFEVVI